ncbi:hypothetical protein SELSPUOL_01606 [Selenomonas sputigena ATCC 35185]|uniref:Uncharacterized protein n=1 Tax=Selenomonas sputigena (strain ATCC 35185 / DSM 20758 / CCUG 44933 / VPI D19B-28) TaxID=546271 RepID=C9LVW1_SELS3|nr:hypothetical protein SELSPUOL_01606 [Selenomonas sputigena ATCC 35185]
MLSEGTNCIIKKAMLPARTFERGSCRSRCRVYTKGASAAS